MNSKESFISKVLCKHFIELVNFLLESTGIGAPVDPTGNRSCIQSVRLQWVLTCWELYSNFEKIVILLRTKYVLKEELKLK